MKRINKRINGNKCWMEIKMNGKNERNKWRGWMKGRNEWKGLMNTRMKWMKSMNGKDEWKGEWIGE